MHGDMPSDEESPLYESYRCHWLTVEWHDCSADLPSWGQSELYIIVNAALNSRSCTLGIAARSESEAKMTHCCCMFRSKCSYLFSALLKSDLRPARSRLCQLLSDDVIMAMLKQSGKECSFETRKWRSFAWFVIWSLYTPTPLPRTAYSRPTPAPGPRKYQRRSAALAIAGVQPPTANRCAHPCVCPAGTGWNK